jgi:hypothetical protein
MYRRQAIFSLDEAPSGKIVYRIGVCFFTVLCHADMCIYKQIVNIYWDQESPGRWEGRGSSRGAGQGRGGGIRGGETDKGEAVT